MRYIRSTNTAIERRRAVRARCSVNRRGFTLIEMLASVTVVSILAAIAVPRVSEQIEKGRVARAIGDIRALQADIEGYTATHGDSLPPTLAAITRGSLRDPWGNVYVYSPFSVDGGSPRTDQFGISLNARYDLYSRGKDEATSLSITASASQDDVVRGADGGFIGKGSTY